MRTHVSLDSNLNHKTRKTKTKTQHLQDKNLARFYYKNKTKQNKVVMRKHAQN
jgi:hypothetical protein